LQFGDNADVIDCACYINRAALEKYRQPPDGDHDAAIRELKSTSDFMTAACPDYDTTTNGLAIQALQYCKVLKGDDK
jgi:hypothetical protein